MKTPLNQARPANRSKQVGPCLARIRTRLTTCPIRACTSAFLIALLLFCCRSRVFGAEQVEDSANASKAVRDGYHWVAGEVGWVLPISHNYELTRVETLFYDNWTYSPATLEVYSAPPSQGGVLLRSAGFWTYPWGFVGASFAPLEVSAGQSVFIGFRNVANVGVNTTADAGATSLPQFWSSGTSGTYANSTTSGASTQPILKLYGQWPPSPGILDNGFGTGGKAITSLGSVDYGQAIAIQGDGKILLAGSSNIGSDFDFGIVRYRADGTHDPDFGGTGKVTTSIGGNDFCDSMVVQADGKIVLAGTAHNGSNYDFAIARYNPDGTLDISFGGTGKVVLPIGGGDDRAYGVALQHDNRIVVGGYTYNGSNTDFAVLRLNADGTLDTGFGSSGKTTTSLGGGDDICHKLALQADGRIVLVGQTYTGSNNDFAVVRYLSNGTLDTSFGGTGKVITPIGGGDDNAHALAISRDGRILVTGAAMVSGAFDIALARYLADGSFDTSFGTNGKVTTAIGPNEDYGRAVVLREDGKILVAGRTVNAAGYSDFALLRYTSSGGLDTTFSSDGKVITPVGSTHDEGRSLAVQGDGKLVIGGFAYDGANVDFAVARYAGDIPQVEMDWATVGNINNPDDPADGDYFTSGVQNHGAVGYVYKIGKYEVTIGQYATFLNQVAKSDPYGLWNAAMASELKIAGIGRSGSDGNYLYSMIGTPNRPVTYVSWFDAARFANWMHNGQGSGSTETGAYTLNGATSGIIPVNAGAKFRLPGENEWYKAAYYDPSPGAGGGDNFWIFPYRSNSAGDNTTFANFFDVDYVGSGTSSAPTGNALTQVGAYTASASHFGTFDQGGNVWEWIDAVAGGTQRIQRGGAWNNYASDMAPQARIPASPTTEYYDQGFRLAAPVPVVADYAATPASPRPNQAVSFDASTSSPVEGIVSYSWNWGDGSPLGSGALASHTYTNAGTYTVTLTVTDSLGGTATKTSTVTAGYPVNIEWVTVSNPGNAADTATGFGAVGHAYRIGKYEVTNSQYAAFLNNVDSSGANPNSIYHPGMGSDARGGINFSAGAPAGSKYSVKPNMGNKPVNYVSWYDAARFVNWLASEQGAGGTETGSYTMSGGGVIYKNAGATIWIPTENEWYKAAFYDPTPGAGGGDNYWSYPTRSDAPPTGGVVNATGTITNPGANVANYLYSAVWNGMNGNVTTVGSAAANNYFGTFDQGGNVWEWNDAVIGTARGTRGGSYDNHEIYLVSSYRNSADPSVKSSGLGFRVASLGDVVPPALTSVHITSDNASTTWAKTPNIVTLSFTTDEAIQTPAVTLLGAAATATNTGGNNWTANVTVGAGTAEGAAAFSVTATDLYGNTAPAVTATTDSSSVTVDKTAPVPVGLSNLTIPTTSAAGAVASYSPGATDNLDPSPAVNATPTSGSTFPIGTTTVNVDIADAAGNSTAGSFTVTVTNASHAPHFTTTGTVPVSANGFNATGMTVGAVTLGFAPAPGTVLTLIDNTSGNPIGGAFTDLPDGGTLVTSFGGNSYRFLASYSGGDGNDLTLTLLAPEIVVESPVSGDVPDGGSRTFGTLVLGGSADLTFVVKNTGPGILNGLEVTKTGTDHTQFTVMAAPAAPLEGPSGSTVFTVRFTPTSGGAKNAVIHIASDDEDENPFDITLTGQALSISDDTDGDGLNDAAEFKLADLGYDWQVSQPALVNTLLSNANFAGLYTQSQVQTLHAGTPLISRDPATGRFTLKMDWKKSTDLQRFFDFPAQPGDVSVDPLGDIIFEFTSPDDAAFFRVEAK